MDQACKAPGCGGVKLKCTCKSPPVYICTCAGVMRQHIFHKPEKVGFETIIERLDALKKSCRDQKLVVVQKTEALVQEALEMREEAIGQIQSTSKECSRMQVQLANPQTRFKCFSDSFNFEILETERC